MMKTSISISSVARASALALALASSAAHAVEVTVNRDAATVVDGISYALNPANTSQWEFGYHASGLMSVLLADITATGGASLATTPGANQKHTSITLTMPVSTVTGEALQLGSALSFGTQRYAHDGGITITVPSEVAGRRNAATSIGGSLTLTNLQVDLSTQRVYADVSNPTSTPSRIPLWEIVTHTSGGMAVTGFDAEVGAVATIHSLRLTDLGHAAFSSGFALNSLGKAALSATTSFGTITAAVPEPSTWALAVFGVLGVGAMARRRATTH